MLFPPDLHQLLLAVVWLDIPLLLLLLMIIAVR